MTVDLGGITRGQMYYCKAAATNIGNSTSCLGPVIGGVKMFFSMRIVANNSGRYEFSTHPLVIFSNASILNKHDLRVYV